jgi:ATP-binding cassette subfamily F protein 3
MDRIATHILGLHRHKVRKIEGQTEKYYNQIAQEEEIYEKTRINDERKRKRWKSSLTASGQSPVSRLVQSRLKYIEKMESWEKLKR